MSRMLALVCLAGAVLSPLFTLQVAAQAANPADALHEACHVDAAGTTFRIYVDGAGTTYTRTANGTAQSFAYEVLAMPAAGAAWSQGKAFGNKAQKKDVFPVDDDKVKSATWTRDASTRVDTFTFVTKHEVEVVFTSTRCAGWNNCPFRGGYAKHCWSELETCCGYNTLGATCMPKDGSYQCCSHYLSARACNSTQTCCGMSGPGASSYAFCCDAGSTCCQASTSYNGAASCCPSGTTCCRGYSFGLCCGAGETCDSFNNRCVSATPSTSPAPVPTPEPTLTPEPSSMPAPTTP